MVVASQIFFLLSVSVSCIDAIFSYQGSSFFCSFFPSSLLLLPRNSLLFLVWQPLIQDSHQDTVARGKIKLKMFFCCVHVMYMVVKVVSHHRLAQLQNKRLTGKECLQWLYHVTLTSALTCSIIIVHVCNMTIRHFGATFTINITVALRKKRPMSTCL